MSHQLRRKFLIQSMAALAAFGVRRRASAGHPQEKGKKLNSILLRVTEP